MVENLTTNQQNLNKTQLILLDGKLYQLIILPVQAPRTIAYAIIGFQIDQAFVNELKRLMAIEVSFLYQEQLIISTLKHPDSAHSKHFKETDKSWLLFERKIYENKAIVFTNTQGSEYIAQLSVDLMPSYNELDKLVLITLLISLLIITITAFACSVIARSLTKPLYQLTRLTRKFSEGNYEHKEIASQGSLEVTRVYNSFIKMGQKIEQREGEINYQAKHDVLTDVYNRSTLLDLLSKQISSHDHSTYSSLLVMVINVRHFKRINDSLGSGTGDGALKAIAQRT
ncbi:MAG: HAMP domain-containing protein [Colwellia sp.]